MLHPWWLRILAAVGRDHWNLHGDFPKYIEWCKSYYTRHIRGELYELEPSMEVVSFHVNAFKNAAFALDMALLSVYIHQRHNNYDEFSPRIWNKIRLHVLAECYAIELLKRCFNEVTVNVAEYVMHCVLDQVSKTGESDDKKWLGIFHFYVQGSKANSNYDEWL